MYAQLLATLLYFGVLQGDLAQQPAVRAALWQLMTETRYGFSETEEAMFIVREADGRFAFVRWSSLQLPRRARWEGAHPRHVVAIAHTHPNWRPAPSRIDMQTALRARLPVYVVTRTRITKTTGRDTRVVWVGEWRP